MLRRSPASVRGFTLLELMIVVAVVAIVAAIAYPNYIRQVRRAHRTQAMSDLVEIAQMLERTFTTDRDYRLFALSGDLDHSPRRGTARYAVALGSVTRTTFTLTATPQGDQRADVCGTLTLTHTGARTPVDASCW